MPSYTSSIEIAAAPAVVFEYVADLTKHGEWSVDRLEVTALEGDRYHSLARSKGKDIQAELILIERTPPERLVFDAIDLTGRWRHTFTLEPNATGTRVQREIAGELSGAQLALFWLVLLPIKKPNAARALHRLKERIESAP